MNSRSIISAGFGLFLAVLVLFVSCTKNTNPQPPVTDTVTVIKNDTTVKNDTIYATKPDTTVNLTKGLLLYLPFSGNIADSSGNGNPTASIGGNVLTYDEHGYANSAFGGSGAQEVLVTNNGSIQFDTAFSLSFGFMVNANVQQAYISMVNPINGAGPSFIIGTTFAGISYLDDGINDVSAGCSVSGTISNVNVDDTTKFAPNPGSWYNAILVYHKGSIYTYINGTLIGSTIGIGTADQLCPASQIVIGGWWNGQPLNINGKLDNVRLYDRVLTPHEIVALSSSYQITSNSVKSTPRSQVPSRFH